MMNAPAKVKKVNANLAIWDALATTDPKHTKSFARAGGFKGTAVKPIWIVKRLTEQFGPCGVGWGIGEPQFQVVPANGETLVYCTVPCWHGNPKNILYGVGGDKVLIKRQSGHFCDDEAFKKAFTDAVGNAFKFIGVSADIHMGQFDDSKYVAEAAKQFEEPRVAEVGAKEKDGDWSPSALKGALRTMVHNINGCGDLAEFEAYLATPEANEAMEQCQRRAPAWWETGEGMPAEFVPLSILIENKRRELTELEDIHRSNPILAG